MRELVDRPRSSWLELVCTSPLVRPGHPPQRPGTTATATVLPSILDGAHRGSAACARCCKPTWRRVRMKMRCTIGVSLAIFAISAAVAARQAHSNDRSQEPSAKAKPAEPDAHQATVAARQQLADNQPAAARIE